MLQRLTILIASFALPVQLWADLAGDAGAAAGAGAAYAGMMSAYYAEQAQEAYDRGDEEGGDEAASQIPPMQQQQKQDKKSQDDNNKNQDKRGDDANKAMQDALKAQQDKAQQDREKMKATIEEANQKAQEQSEKFEEEKAKLLADRESDKKDQSSQDLLKLQELTDLASQLKSNNESQSAELTKMLLGSANQTPPEKGAPSSRQDPIGEVWQRTPTQTVDAPGSKTNETVSSTSGIFGFVSSDFFSSSQQLPQTSADPAQRVLDRKKRLKKSIAEIYGVPK